MKTPNQRYYESISETAFMNTVIQAAEALGWQVYHTHDSRRSQKGFPDVVMIRRGRLVVVELKTEKGVVTREQQAWLELFRSAGVPAYVWRPSDQWQEILQREERKPAKWLLFSDRLKLEKMFQEHLEKQPRLMSCPLNFLAWLPTTEEGREAILVMANEITSRPELAEPVAPGQDGGEVASNLISLDNPADAQGLIDTHPEDEEEK